MSRWLEEVRARRRSRRVDRALARATALLVDADGVSSVGIGRGADGLPVIVVGVDADLVSVREAVPGDVDGVPLVVRKTGGIRAHEE